MGKRPHRAATRQPAARQSAPAANPRGLVVRIVLPGLTITAPDPLAVGLGGTETAALQLAAELVRQGHHVTLIGNCGGPFTWKGVRLIHGDLMAAECERPCDLFIATAEPLYLDLRGQARVALLWMHCLLEVEQLPRLMLRQHLADKIMTVSQWQTDQFRSVAPQLAADRFLVARNGVDLDLVAEAFATAPERDPYRIVYTSKPGRGLELLLKRVLPRILEAEPRASLHHATYPYLEEPVPASYYNDLRAAADYFGDRVVDHDAMNKLELYRLMASSGVYLYPTPAPSSPGFAETSCITAMEAMACGLPWVSTDRGALPETVGAGGVLVPLGDAPDANDPAVLERLAQEALRVMHDRAYAEGLRAAGLERAASLSWKGVAKQLVAEVARLAPQPARPLAPIRIMIATPAYDHRIAVAYAKSLLGTAMELWGRNIDLCWWPRCGDSLLPASRNLLAAEFLGLPQFTHLLWIDSDITWKAEDVIRLLAHDQDLVGGLYRTKSMEESYDFQPLPGAVPDRRTGLLEVDCCGLGFMLTKRRVYEAMAAAFPDRRIDQSGGLYKCDGRDPPRHFDFFRLGFQDGVYTTEDFSFCRDWRAIGGKVLVDVTLKLSHHGGAVFAGDPARLFAPAVGAAAA